MLSVKAREAADTIFEVFGMTQLRIKPILPCFAGERSNHQATKQVLTDGMQDEALDTRMDKASAVMSFAIFGCHETRIIEKSKALSSQNSFHHHPHLWS